MNEKEPNVPTVRLSEKRLLTITEASQYFGIGQGTLKRISDDPQCDFVLWIGRKRMFKRVQLEKFIEKAWSL